MAISVAPIVAGSAAISFVPNCFGIFSRQPIHSFGIPPQYLRFSYRFFPTEKINGLGWAGHYLQLVPPPLPGNVLPTLKWSLAISRVASIISGFVIVIVLDL